MNTIMFILGIILGIGWQRYRFERQLKQMLISLSDSRELITSLPLLSLVRREITHLHQNRQQLNEELNNYKDILEQAPIGYLQIDGDNQLLWCNQQARHLLKIDRWQAGKVRLLLELVRSYELDLLIEHTRSSQIAQEREWLFYPSQYVSNENLENTTQSQRKALTLKAFSFPLPQGQVGVILENREPLAELSRRCDRSISDLTHELRTPLTSISLLAEALQKRLQNQERQWTEQILKEIERLMQLINDWLDITQLHEDPSQYLHYQTIELKTLIKNAWNCLIPLAKQKEITLSYSDTDPLELQADQARLTQIFINLFDNSIKHSPPQSSIILEVHSNQKRLNIDTTPQTYTEIIIDVIDYGEGFLEADLPFVFERLYRGEPSRARKPCESESSRHGTGLGLSIVQQLVEAHGGTVQAQNHPETGGAWIQLRLPSQPCAV